MNKAPEVKIIPAFAVPFGASFLADCGQMNAELKKLFLSRETDMYRNKMRNSVEAVGMLNQYKRSRVKEFDVYADAWYHITRKGGCFTNHNHPMASWSAVYCIADGIDDGDTPESGLTRFFHPQTAASTYLDAGNFNMTQAPYGYGHQVFKLNAGQILIFPSWLYHEVSSYMGNSERIIVAVNYWFNHPQMDPQIGPKISSGKR